jgi:hypothetical protein
LQKGVHGTLQVHKKQRRRKMESRKKSWICTYVGTLPNVHMNVHVFEIEVSKNRDK